MGLFSWLADPIGTAIRGGKSPHNAKELLDPGHMVYPKKYEGPLPPDYSAMGFGNSGVLHQRPDGPAPTTTHFGDTGGYTYMNPASLQARNGMGTPPAGMAPPGVPPLIKAPPMGPGGQPPMGPPGVPPQLPPQPTNVMGGMRGPGMGIPQVPNRLQAMALAQALRNRPVM